jgi:hypothetical protein
MGIPRKYWYFSAATFLAVLVYWLCFEPMVFVYSADPQHHVTFTHVLEINVLAYSWLLFPPP